jgi:enamine deaminase RidA (YjgF/YER057c/UK114 family)
MKQSVTTKNAPAAQSAVSVKTLSKNALVEIEVITVID